MSGEGGCVVGNADHQSAPIFMDIVDAVRDGDTDGIGTEIMIIDAPRGTVPTTAGVFEVAYQFAFLAVDADNGQMALAEAVAQMGEIFELEVTVGTAAGGNLLLIDAERIAQLMEQTGDGVGGDRNPECGQFGRNARGRAAGPA